MEKTDILIVGAGPAGLKAAEILASKNKQVLVLEKNRIIGDKVCAGVISRNCLRKELPISLVERRFNECLIHSPLQNTRLHLDEPILATVNRKRLGTWMAKQAVQNGTEITRNTTVVEIKKDSVIDENGNETKFKFLIGADGSNSVVRKHLGIPTKRIAEAFHYLTPKKFDNVELFYDPQKFGPAYAWIFPHKEYTSIGTGGEIVPNGWFKKGIKELRCTFDLWCEDKFSTKKATFQAAAINYDYRGCVFMNKFLIGDAAGLASGASGEGIYFGILSGKDIANRILDKNYKMVNIEHIIRIKKLEETYLKSLEISKGLTTLELECFVLLLKFRWFGDVLSSNLD